MGNTLKCSEINHVLGIYRKVFSKEAVSVSGVKTAQSNKSERKAANTQIGRAHV